MNDPYDSLRFLAARAAERTKSEEERLAVLDAISAVAGKLQMTEIATEAFEVALSIRQSAERQLTFFRGLKP